MIFFRIVAFAGGSTMGPRAGGGVVVVWAGFAACSVVAPMFLILYVV
jgi:hypothetical protein